MCSRMTEGGITLYSLSSLSESLSDDKKVRFISVVNPDGIGILYSYASLYSFCLLFLSFSNIVAVVSSIAAFFSCSVFLFSWSIHFFHISSWLNPCFLHPSNTCSLYSSSMFSGSLSSIMLNLDPPRLLGQFALW